MKKIVLLCLAFAMLIIILAQGFIIDHICTNLDIIPQVYIDAAKADLYVGYGHTSHGG